VDPIRARRDYICRLSIPGAILIKLLRLVQKRNRPERQEAEIVLCQILSDRDHVGILWDTYFLLLRWPQARDERDDDGC